MFSRKSNYGNLPHRVTIKDVAKEAGVSVSTVSHVLNDYEDISEETKRLVRETMEALNYYPSAVARRLTQRRSHLIHLFLFSKEGLHHPFFYEVICGIAEEAEKSDYEFMLSVQQADDDRRWRHSLRRSTESRVEGLIFMGVLPNSEVFDKLETIQTPTVFIDIPYGGDYGSYLSSDNIRGSKLAVEHLLKLGHRKIAFLGGDYEGSLVPISDLGCKSKESVSHFRFRGYAQALAEYNIEVDPSLIGYGEFAQKSAHEAVLKILKRHPDLDAVFAASDLMAIGAIDAIRSIGKDVPDDIAVIGYDNIESCSFVSPSLSTIRQDGTSMGRKAVQELQRLINEPDATFTEVILPVELMIRESCGAKKVKHQDKGVEDKTK